MAVDLLVQVDVAALDHDAHLVDLDVEVDDDHLLDVLVVLALDPLLHCVCKV